MRIMSRLEHADGLDKIVSVGQRLARTLRPGRYRDFLHGVWLGHPLHPVLVQVAAGAWLSASILDFMPDGDRAARRLAAVGLAMSAPTAVAGMVDWSEQHEQLMRVGVVHAAANLAATGLYGWSLVARDGRYPRLGGLATLTAGGLLGSHMSFHLAGGVNHAEAVPHLIEPGWHDLVASTELRDDEPARRMLGEVPVVVVRSGGRIHALADRCGHMSGPLSDGDLSDGCLICPWHGSMFRVADGSVARGPATVPQPAFETRVVAGNVQARLPGAG